VAFTALMNEGIPLNRKERFFTGTVFPMIICRDSFKYFNLFTSLIDGCGNLEISANPKSLNLQFFTEYSLVESIVTKEDKRRFPNPPRSKDTPDIIVLYTGSPKTLISIEAKMYDVPYAWSLRKQMDNQRIHLEYLKDRLNISKVHQCALLPEKLRAREGYENSCIWHIQDSNYQIITWEQLYDVYQKEYPEDYFLGLLKYALDSYCALVSHWVVNYEEKIRGQVIYNKFKSGTLNVKIMGREKGVNGELLKQDIETGKWITQEYETGFKGDSPSENWFPVEEFVKRIDDHKG
jgi:hypothetical protein